MKHMTLAAIASACGGQYLGDESLKDTEIKGAVIDSRQVQEGYLFIAVKGARSDGHDFVGQAFEQGAAAVLVERPDYGPGPYILVESSLQALKDIAAFYRRQLDIPVIGVIGSVGKTSTKEMVASVLSSSFCVLKTEGNFNNEIGLPLTILRIRDCHQAAVVEMGISDFGEMHRLAEIARPDMCVITNIGTCHLERLKDRDGVLRAKTEVFDHMEEGAAVILNGDDDKLAAIREVNGKPPIFYAHGRERKLGDLQNAYFARAGADGHCSMEGEMENDIYPRSVRSLGFSGMAATLHTPQGEMEIMIPIPGEHHLHNAMAAVAVGLQLGLTPEHARKGIAAAEAISGRSNIVEANGMTVLDDCYNANPMSMKAALKTLGSGVGRKVAILGDMGELGEREQEFHYEVGAYASQANIDVLICVGSLSEQMRRGAQEAEHGDMEILHYPTREELQKNLSGIVKKGDAILVKASHFMGFSEIVKQLIIPAC